MVKGRRILSLALALCFLLVQRAYGVEVSATAAVLMDADTGEILFEKNADKQMLIASTTKILTALVVLQSCDMQKPVCISAQDMAEGSSMYLKAGETVTVETLLYGLLLQSGNDAAMALANACGGIKAFTVKMNALAREIGMNSSHFENPNGLDGESHYSTARDMAKLAAYAMEDPTFVRICSTKTANVGGRSMKNHNRLLRELDGCIGLKTGYTKAAGRTLVTCAERDGRRLVAVTLQDGNDWLDHKTLYEYGFGQGTSTQTAFLYTYKTGKSI